jgi:hypothetical protein
MVQLEINILGGKNTFLLQITIDLIKKIIIARCWWLIPIILATQEAEVQSQPGQIVP